MSSPLGWSVLAAIATAADGLLSGASLDQSIKQLPSRHRIGVLAFSAYSIASDLTTGVLWYATLGIGAAALTVATAIWALSLTLPAAALGPALLAGALSIAHSLTTVRAAPINWSQRLAVGDEQELASIFDRFARWQALRAALQLATLMTMVWLLTVI